MMHAAAPLRLDFAGGWTDVEPFTTRVGGVVVNAAIELYAHAMVEPGGPVIRLVAQDLNEVVEVGSSAELRMDGQLRLHQAAVRMYPPGRCVLTTRCDAPRGSGLGSSGALDVALVAVLLRARGEELSPGEIAEEGWRLETVEAGIAGGRQDQYAAALGGFHRLTFGESVGVEPLVLDPAFTDELARRIILCYTGTSRLSGKTIARVIGGYERGDPTITAAFMGIRDAADAMAGALRAADFARVGALLNENWRHQQRLDPGMRTDEMARLERAMLDAGALGGKAAGAGAGGCMFFLAASASAADLTALHQAAGAAGATVLPVSWAGSGVQTW